MARDQETPAALKAGAQHPDKRPTFPGQHRSIVPDVAARLALELVVSASLAVT